MMIIYAPRALDDLRMISATLEPKSLSGAAAIMSRIERTIDLLERFPHSGRRLSARSNVRVLPI